jgi:Glycosyl transferases group 1
MRLMFVYWRIGDAGSVQTLIGYAKAAETLGHEVLMYAPEEQDFPLKCSLDLESADAVILNLEWNMYQHPGEYSKTDGRLLRPGLMGIGHLNVVRLVSKIPRKRRIIIDDDGMYTAQVHVDGDFSHPDESASRLRIETYDSLSDKIYQPTLHPSASNVGTFLFHAYNPELEVPLNFSAKQYGMVYVGSNWFRWRPMQRVLKAIEPVREHVGQMTIVGRDWDRMPPWVPSPLREQAYYTDPAYLRRLRIELKPPVPARCVISTMSKGVFNPVVVRPIFHHFQLVNPRMFETPAANTIPLFGLNPTYVREIYGDRATALVLGENASDQIRDVLNRPDHYADIVRDIRRHLAEKHSYAARLNQLLQIVQN